MILTVGLNVWSWWPAAASVWLSLVCASLMWPKREEFMPGSRGESSSVAVPAMRGPLMGLSTALRIGPGPGCAAQESDSAVSRWAPVAYSTVAAVLAATAGALMDFAVQYALSHPAAPVLVLEQISLDSSLRNPGVTVPLSALCGWWCAQAAATGFRQVKADDETLGVAPAAVFDSGLGDFFKEVLSQRVLMALTGVCSAAIVVALWWWPIATDVVGWISPAGLVAVAAAAVLFWHPLRRRAADQHTAWEAKEKEAKQWTLRWANAKGVNLDEAHAPKLHESADLPPPGDDPNNPVTPKFRTLLFLLQPGTQFTDVANGAKQIASAIGKQKIVIERYSPSGEEHMQAFSLSHELEDLGATPHLNQALDPMTLEFSARWAILNAFRDLKMPTPVFLQAEKLTSHGPPILMTAWRLTDGLTFPDVANKADKLQELLACDWCRPYLPDATNYIGIVYGAHPSKAHLRKPADKLMAKLESIDWSYYMRANYILGSDMRAPTLIAVDEAPLGLKELKFRYPPAVDSKQVSAVLDKLKSMSGHGHIEMGESPKEPGCFTLLVGDSDPLQGMYPFGDYVDEMLSEPVRGQPNTDWAVGMTAAGRLLKYRWDGEEPHLLVAGSSGSGKSGVINSFISQLLHNNHPDDCVFWLVEPKNELHAYKNLVHVTRFLDSQVTSDSPNVAFAGMVSEAITEMARRYTAFAEHPARPQKLAEARELAQAHPDTAGHLNFPYVFIVVEECANYFTKPVQPSPEDKKAYASIMHDIQKLARESRAAGIHLLLATQYPTKENIPMTLKQQCRRIGLPTSSAVASMVIIDQGGLEKLKGPGRGMMADGSKLIGFRGLLQTRSEGRDDRADIINALLTNETWPKLPEGVNMGGLVTPVGEPVECAPVAPVAPAPKPDDNFTATSGEYDDTAAWQGTSDDTGDQENEEDEEDEASEEDEGWEDSETWDDDEKGDAGHSPDWSAQTAPAVGDTRSVGSGLQQDTPARRSDSDDETLRQSPEADSTNDWQNTNIDPQPEQPADNTNDRQDPPEGSPPPTHDDEEHSDNGWQAGHPEQALPRPPAGMPLDQDAAQAGEALNGDSAHDPDAELTALHGVPHAAFGIAETVPSVAPPDPERRSRLTEAAKAAAVLISP